MSYTIVGLGNPGDEYKKSRHNTGAMVVEHFARTHKADDWESDKKLRAQKTTASLGGKNIRLVLPQTFMNRSGSAVKSFISTARKAEKELIVVYDDIDLPFGAIKISYGRSSGGHRGLASVITAIGSKNFARLRVGISPTTPTGKLKKPKGEQKVVDFLMAELSKKENNLLKKMITNASEALLMIVQEGRERTMNKYN